MSIVLTVLGTIAGSASVGVAKHISNSTVRNLVANSLGNVCQNGIEEGFKYIKNSKKKKKKR